MPAVNDPTTMMASVRPKDARPTLSRSYTRPSSSDSRNPIRMYAGVVATWTCHGWTSSHPIVIAAPNSSQPAALRKRGARGRTAALMAGNLVPVVAVASIPERFSQYLQPSHAPLRQTLDPPPRQEAWHHGPPTSATPGEHFSAP